jgi:hypothetical protein
MREQIAAVAEPKTAVFTRRDGVITAESLSDFGDFGGYG